MSHDNRHELAILGGMLVRAQAARSCRWVLQSGGRWSLRLPVRFEAGLALTTAGTACDDGSRTTAADVVDRIGGEVPLRMPTDDFLMTQLLAGDAFETEFGADRVEARLRADDEDENSFVIVADRDGGFDDEDLGAFVELAEEFGATPRLNSVAEVPGAFASDCCVARLLDGIAVVAGDESGRIKATVLELD